MPPANATTTQPTTNATAPAAANTATGLFGRNSTVISDILRALNLTCESETGVWGVGE